MLTDNAINLVRKRYLDPGMTVDNMFDLASLGNPEYRALMTNLLFLPNSPTLFNAGRGNGCTLSACFVFDVFDCMLTHNGKVREDSIVRTREKAVAVAKAGGGVGYYLGNLRPRNSPIKSVHRVACGPLGVLHDYQQISRLMTQGGRRELAQMAILPFDHPDFPEFIHVKNADPEAYNSFNISGRWTGAGLRTHASLLREQATSAHATGCPGVLFDDHVNAANRNPHLGRINATNPCGETPNRSDEPCNLGSLALPRFVSTNRTIDFDALAHTIRLSIRFMDDILTANVWPHPSIERAALLTRKLGLGVMGFADLLAMMHIHYDTPEALDLSARLSDFIRTTAREASAELARELGPYTGYDVTLTDDVMLRNETVTSIAPTGSIAIIAGCWGGIEPHFALDCQRTTSEGLVLQDGVQAWVRERCEGFTPRIASEISPEWHVRHQAVWQSNTCLGVSKTVNMPNSATVDDVLKVYTLAHELGCKGVTVFRDGCRSEQVLVKAKTKSRYHVNRLTPTRDAITHEVHIGGHTVFFTISTFDDGAPAELFLRVGKIGSSVAGMLDAWAIAFSTALQRGTPLTEFVKHYIGMRFEPNGLTDNPVIPACTSIHDYVCRWMLLRFAPDVAPQPKSGQLCPECGAELLLISGCLTCTSNGCGWTRCG